MSETQPQETQDLPQGDLAHQTVHLVPAAETDQRPVTPYEFVHHFGEQLDDNANMWREVAGLATELRSEEFLEPARDFITDCFGTLGYSNLAQENAAIKLNGDMSVYILMSARYISSRQIPEDSREKITSYATSMPTAESRAVVARSSYPVERSEDIIFDMATRMNESETGTTHEILNALVGVHERSPDFLEELACIYEEGAAEGNPRFRELQQLISQDWHDKEHSTLRRYRSVLAGEDQAIYVGGFAKSVAEAKNGTQLGRIRNVAMFALIHAGLDTTNENIAEAIEETRGSWDLIEGMKSAFNTFSNTKIQEVEKLFMKIAGPKNNKSIRTHRTRQDIDQLGSSLVVNLAINRRHKRTKTKRAPGLDAVSSSPSIDDIDLAADAERTAEPKNLLAVKQRLNGRGNVETQQAGDEDLLKTFGIKNGSCLHDDMKSVLRRIQEEPVSAASHKLIGNHKIRVGRKDYSLWRFAPDDAQGIGIHPDNRYMRIVYAILPDGVAVVDILNHDSFDKKYT